MRSVLVIIGIVLVAAGIYAAAGQASYKTNKDVLKVGGAGISVQESHGVPAWAGAIGIVVGGVLIFAGARRP
ncbi:MAG TPA: hypothetical protein VGL62_12145 [Vicinamibacterales bacterium]|jgi:uncharacterized membrane protein